VYVSENNLYRKVKKRRTLIYLKCHYDPCDGSAKIEHGELFGGKYAVTMILVIKLIYSHDVI